MRPPSNAHGPGSGGASERSPAAADDVRPDAGDAAATSLPATTAASSKAEQPHVPQEQRTEAARGAAGSSARGEDAANGHHPEPGFWVDLAKGLVELLTHSRGVAGSLAAARTAVNTSVDKYEAILRELKTNTVALSALQVENKALAGMVKERKASVEGMTPEARAQSVNDIVKCRVAYAAMLRILFKDAATTSAVWLGQAPTTAVIHTVVSSTLGLTVKEAEEMVNGKRESSRAAGTAGTRATPRSSPTVKVFSNRRATFYKNLSDVIVKAWKETVMFATDPNKILAAAVAWLNMDKYIMSPEGLKGIVAAIRAMFAALNCEATLIVQGEVGDSGYVRALLGHASFVSTKVSLRHQWASAIPTRGDGARGAIEGSVWGWLCRSRAADGSVLLGVPYVEF